LLREADAPFTWEGGVSGGAVSEAFGEIVKRIQILYFGGGDKRPTCAKWKRFVCAGLGSLTVSSLSLSGGYLSKALAQTELLEEKLIGVRVKIGPRAEEIVSQDTIDVARELSEVFAFFDLYIGYFSILTFVIAILVGVSVEEGTPLRYFFAGAAAAGFIIFMGGGAA